MQLPLYWTIWIALALFVSGQALRPARAGLAVYSAGFVLAVVHILIAMGAVHGWSHASALAATAAQTNAFFGLDWGGGVYVNYLFIAVWAGELIVWTTRPDRYAAWSGWSLWLVRGFYLIMIANAAIVFAAGWRPVVGALAVLALALIWLEDMKRVKDVKAQRTASRP